MTTAILPGRSGSFRLRSWCTLRDLDALQEAPDPELPKALESFSDTGSATAYALADFLGKKWSSVQSRLVGRRGGSTFRMGPLDSLQKDQIAKAGYSLQTT